MKHLLAICLVLLVACGGDPAPQPDPKPETPVKEPQPEPKPEPKPEPAEMEVSKDLLKDPTHAHWSTKAPETYTVRFETTKGTFTVECTRAWAPIGADRFHQLVKAGFYDDVYVFRVVPNFVVQFGMNGDPATTEIWSQQNLKDEPVKQSNSRGFLTYAKTKLPNTRSTQLFINLVNNRRLDNMGFAPFGRVTGQGMQVVDKLYNGYARNVPDQGLIARSGNAYLKKNYPKLDRIIKARIIEMK